MFKGQLLQFLMIYLLLLIVLWVMRRNRIDQAKLLVIASVKMTTQLIVAGLILSYLFADDHPWLTLAYLILMMAFTVHRVLSQNQMLNRRFRCVIALSMLGAGLFVLVYFIAVVVRVPLTDPQYVVPLGGMILGNTMTGTSLALKTFREALSGQQAKINALLCAGVSPQNILRPFARQALETAMLPTLNSMLGMGIVFLPGMMTGQILAGALPTTAILYQMAIMIAICTAVTCACFAALFLGSRTLIDSAHQILRPLGF